MTRSIDAEWAVSKDEPILPKGLWAIESNDGIRTYTDGLIAYVRVFIGLNKNGDKMFDFVEKAFYKEMGPGFFS